MKRRKQMLAAGLAGLTTFSLTACGGSNTAATQAESAKQAENRQTEGSNETQGNTEAVSDEEEAESAEAVVQTTAGLVQGTNEDDIYRYLGVPYAQATERFVPAEDAAPWDGIRMADSYGPISPQ